MPTGLKNRKKPEAIKAPAPPAPAKVDKAPKPPKTNAFYAKNVNRALNVGLRESQDMQPADAIMFLTALNTELHTMTEKGDFEPPFIDRAVLAAKERVEKQRELDAAK